MIKSHDKSSRYKRHREGIKPAKAVFRNSVVRIIKTGEIVKVYYVLANGICYVGKNGIVFIEDGEFEKLDYKEA